MARFIRTTPIIRVDSEAYWRHLGPMSLINERRLDPMRMNRKHIRQMCNELSLRKFSERW